MKKVIVTGSHGFIGSYLVRHLAKMGVEVLEIDKKIGENAKYIDYHLNACIAQGEGKPDTVIHLAAQTSVWNEDDTLIADDNITAFTKVAEACRKFGVPLVYASSSCAQEQNITSHYGLSKKYNEDLAKLRYSDIAIGLRFHNVYAAYPREGTLPHFLFNEEVVKLYNEGVNFRHFTYIEDILRGICLAAEKAISGDFSVPVYNICNPEYISTKDFADEVCKHRKDLSLILLGERRKLDKIWQNTDNLPHLFADYTSVSKGVAKCFAIRNQK